MWKEDISRAGQETRDQTCGFLGGGQSSRLSDTIEDVSYCIVSRNVVTIPTTSNLVISELEESKWEVAWRMVSQPPLIPTPVGEGRV